MKPKSVYIGIPAHNEERNIGKLLGTILDQKGDNFTLKSVVVACDGCTDSTADIVRSLAKKNDTVKVIDDGRRVGQAQRLNEFYKIADTDIFITFDADVALSNEHVVSRIVAAFNDPKVGLVGGCDMAVAQKTFVGKALYAYQIFWRELVDSIDEGNNVNHHPGCVSAARVDFLKKVSIPLDILANDHFLYFQNLRQGNSFKAATDAVVFFKVPTNLYDYLKQTTRFHDSADNIRNHFGEWVEDHYRIPVSKKLRAYAKTFLKTPFYLGVALGLNVIQKVVKSRFAVKSKNGIWSTVKSSK